MAQFTDDKEKMLDLLRLTKDEFLDSYSYLDEQEYLDTIKEMKQEQLIICPHCGFTSDGHPDFSSKGCANGVYDNNQVLILEEVQDNGFNVLSCESCGLIILSSNNTKKK